MRIQSSQKIYLEYPGLYSSVGIGTNPLWQALRTESIGPQPLEGASEYWPQQQAYPIQNLNLSFLGVDRKTLRTMTRQSHLALYGARLSLAQMAPSIKQNGHTCGLYLGLPTVDEEIPSWSVLERLETRPSLEDLATLFLRETPPFSGLTFLNSSACAHISATFELTGALATFSPFSDAGLQALIEGALSLVENENDMALVGAVSPGVTPVRILQYDALAWHSPQYLGEGVASLMLRKGDTTESGVWIAGYGRTFGTTLDDRADALSHAIAQALDMAKVHPSDIHWILADSPWTEINRQAQHHALETHFMERRNALPILSAERVTGILGPAQPLMHVLLAQHGMRQGRRLLQNPDGTLQEEALIGEQSVLVIACGVYGQCVAVILQGRHPCPRASL